MWYSTLHTRTYCLNRQLAPLNQLTYPARCFHFGCYILPSVYYSTAAILSFCLWITACSTHTYIYIQGLNGQLRVCVISQYLVNHPLAEIIYILIYCATLRESASTFLVGMYGWKSNPYISIKSIYPMCSVT